MSKKIKVTVEENSRSIELTPAEFAYITSLDTVMRSFEHYSRQLKQKYLQTIAIKHGYKADEDIEVSIDLKNEARILTVTKLK